MQAERSNTPRQGPPGCDAAFLILAHYNQDPVGVCFQISAFSDGGDKRYGV